MVERIARAMAEADVAGLGPVIFDVHWAEFGAGYLASARVALQALLSPTEDMLTAGAVAVAEVLLVTSHGLALEEVSELHARAAWPAIVHEALR